MRCPVHDSLRHICLIGPDEIAVEQGLLPENPQSHLLRQLFTHWPGVLIKTAESRSTESR